MRVILGATFSVERPEFGPPTQANVEIDDGLRAPDQPAEGPRRHNLTGVFEQNGEQREGLIPELDANPGLAQLARAGIHCTVLA